MLIRSVFAVVILPLLVSPAFGDVSAEVKALEDAFARGCQAGDVEAVVSLYAENASVIWPGQGEEAKGKAGIAKLATGLCKNTKDLKLTVKSLEAKSLGTDHIAVIGHWEISSTGADGKTAVAEMRATEILTRSGGKLLYLIDHGSVGLPPAP
jgi:uncharacterized protein (TIGR02246 family)